MNQKILLLCLLFSSLIYSKARANETEPNDTRNTANTLALNGSNSGAIGTATDVDWYKVITNGDGKINLTLSVSNNTYCYFALYDNDGTTLLNQTYTSNINSYSVDGLAAGTYYVKIFPYNAGEKPVYTISNTLTVATPANDAEPDSTRAQAIVLPLNGSKTGHINYYYNHHNDSVDVYKVTTTGDGAINLALSVANNQYVYFALYDNDGVTQLHRDYTSSNFNYTVDGLAAGTYYVKIYAYTPNYFAPYTISNTLTVPAQANDAEPDSTRAQAIVLPLNGSKTGHINYYYNHHNDSVDMYKITTTGDGALNLSLSVANNQYIYFALYDNDGTTQLHQDYTSSNYNYTVDGLAAGTYYVKIFPYPGGYFAPYTISNTLTVPAQANDAEPDSTRAQALTLPLNSSVTGHINYYYNNHKDSVDWYKVTTTSDGALNLALSVANNQYIYFALYDNDAKTLLYQNYTSTSYNYSYDGLATGTYYVKIFPYPGGYFAPYTLTDSLYTYTANDDEPNKYAKQAKTLTSDKDNYGHVGFYYKLSRDTTDWFKINYTGNDGTMAVTLTDLPHIASSNNYIRMTIYKDTNAAPIFNNYTSSAITANFTGLAKGYYYININGYSPSDFAAYIIHPDFKQSRPRVTISSYDTLADCLGNSITYKLSGSHAPFTVSLYRFGSFYKKATFNSTFATFDYLPDGVYYSTALGDGAVGYAAGTSDTLTLMPIPSGLKTSAIGSDHAKLNWKVVSCADYYSVRYRVFGTSTWTYTTLAGTINYYIAQGLTPSAIYEWQISATDSLDGMNAKSAYSSSIAFSTTASGFAENNAYENDNLGINGKQYTIYLGVFPNPASSYFTIHYNTSIKDKINATLFDVNGKAVWASGSLAADALNGKQVNVNQFGSGLYYLKITDSKGLAIANTKVSITK